MDRSSSRSAEHEFDFIAWVRAQSAGHPRVPVGIGDDAAVVGFPPPGDMLVTVDMLMEGTDFLMPPATGEQIGRKSLAVNLSDIAAMAGRPVACVVSVALPKKGGLPLGRELFAGLHRLAGQFNVALAGGDTNTWEGPLVVSITVFGDPTGTGPVRRSGARPGDWIMATGSFGGSITGKHFDFVPRVEEALALHQAVSLHSMIDVSDGLAADLRHILDESKVGAILDAQAIPISEAALAMDDERSPLEHALGDGEDFELLFTVSPEDGKRLLTARLFGTPVTRIGEIVAGSDCRLRTTTGSLEPMPAVGWTHRFAERSWSSMSQTSPDPRATLEFVAHSENDTDRLGSLLADVLEPGTVVALVGNLGAGKTRLVRAVAIAAGVDPHEINSPTFVLVHEYEGRWPIYHFDTYRLPNADEFIDLGAQEYFASEGVSFVEWADRVTRTLPADHLRIEIETRGDTERLFRISATGAESQRITERVAQQIDCERRG